MSWEAGFVAAIIAPLLCGDWADMAGRGVAGAVEGLTGVVHLCFSGSDGDRFVSFEIKCDGAFKFHNDAEGSCFTIGRYR